MDIADRAERVISRIDTVLMITRSLDTSFFVVDIIVMRCSDIVATPLRRPATETLPPILLRLTVTMRVRLPTFHVVDTVSTRRCEDIVRLIPFPRGTFPKPKPRRNRPLAATW